MSENITISIIADQFRGSFTILVDKATYQCAIVRTTILLNPGVTGMMLSKTTRAGAPATLEQVRFGEFLLERKLISDEQWLAALADHWSSRSRRSIGETIVAKGFLAATIVESQARVFHDDDVFDAELDVVVVMPRTERVTVPVPRQIRN